MGRPDGDDAAVGDEQRGEVLAAVHSGFEILALVGITQQVQTETVSPVSIETMLDAADLAAPRMGSMLVGLVSAMGSRASS